VPDRKLSADPFSLDVFVRVRNAEISWSGVSLVAATVTQ